MLRFYEGDFAAGSVNIHYYRTNRVKPPCILLHGAFDNGLCWTRTSALLARDYDVILPDAQGHGRSDRLDDRFTSESHADQVAALIYGLDLKKPAIIGHSMGAATAVNLAVKYPQLPAAIVLEDPPWMDPPPPGEKPATGPQVDFRSFLTGLRQMTLEQIIARSRELDPAWSEEERLPWAQAKQQCDPSLFARPFISLRSYTELVSLIQCPALLLYGDAGIVTPAVAENAARLWCSNAPFRAVLVKNAAHNIRRENFPDFFTAVTSFLNEISTSSR